MKKHTIALAMTLALMGCTSTMILLPRDSGTLYRGTMKSRNLNIGTVTVQLEDKTCSGSYARVGSGELYGLFQGNAQSDAQPNSMSAAAYQSRKDSSAYKALMSCTDGTGLRCDVVGAGTGAGAGVCADNKGRTYDLIYTP